MIPVRRRNQILIEQNVSRVTPHTSLVLIVPDQAVLDAAVVLLYGPDIFNIHW